jgi:hypothetical protein
MSEVPNLEHITMGPFLKLSGFPDGPEDEKVSDQQLYFYPSNSFGGGAELEDLPNAKSLTTWIQNYIIDEGGKEKQGRELAEEAFEAAAGKFDKKIVTVLKEKGYSDVDVGNEAITVKGGKNHCGFKILKKPSKEEKNGEYGEIFEKKRTLIFTPNSEGNWEAGDKALDIAEELPEYVSEEMEGGRKRRRRRRKSKRKTKRKRKTKKRKSKRKTKRKRKTKKRRRRKR